MCQHFRRAALGLILWPILAGPAAQSAGPGGVGVRLENYKGPATLRVTTVDRYRLQIDLEPGTERRELALRVELPISGRDAWPVEDVEVRDGQGRAVVVRRGGIEWHKLLIPAPAVRSRYLVQATPGASQPALPAEGERQLRDEKTGLSVTVPRWYDGRRAALSLRFDDSHPTHLTTVIPLLRAYGFRGTFMINPGAAGAGSRRRSDFQAQRAKWEAVAQAGDQELANHTAHHRGAANDAEMDAEVGAAAEAIWRLSPGKSKLSALNLGGGTLWHTSRTLRYYLDKYHLFDASGGSLGMDDVYGQRVAAFRTHLERHLERGLWCRAHFHYIGAGLSTSEENFRATLDFIKSQEHGLWIAGMADVHKYQTERNGCSLSLVESAAERLRLRLTCHTDPKLYDQMLTLEIQLPEAWPTDRIAVTDGAGKPIAIRRSSAGPKTVLRFDAPPRTADYVISSGP